MVKEIPLTRGYVAIVDDADYDAVVAIGPWVASVQKGARLVYAIRSSRGDGPILLHRFLTGWPLTDHINNDGLDNRRSNLRPATHAQNMWNQRPNRNTASGFKGVHQSNRSGRWRARLRKGDADYHLGYYDTAREAALAYDEAARRLFGEFARPNFPN